MAGSSHFEESLKDLDTIFIISETEEVEDIPLCPITCFLFQNVMIKKLTRPDRKDLLIIIEL